MNYLDNWYYCCNYLYVSIFFSCFIFSLTIFITVDDSDDEGNEYSDDNNVDDIDEDDYKNNDIVFLIVGINVGIVVGG